jgi:hypothetical protein
VSPIEIGCVLLALLSLFLAYRIGWWRGFNTAAAAGVAEGFAIGFDAGVDAAIQARRKLREMRGEK